MSYASILVHVQSTPDALPRLKCARALAEVFDATLIGVGAEAVPPAPVDDGYSNMAAQYFTAMRQLTEANLKSANKVFKEVSSGLSKPPLWECGLQTPGPAVANASRGADLIVASASIAGHDDPYLHAFASDLAIASGRPVLVTPPRADPLLGRKVILAWKDSREARRAMADAMPLLERADEVLVLEVCTGDDKINAKIRTDDVVSALKRHGVAAVAKVAAHHSADGPAILHEASRFGADLIVAGAYGHSRLGEWAFGGVTRDLLAQHDRYVLLSH